MSLGEYRVAKGQVKKAAIIYLPLTLERRSKSRFGKRTASEA